MGKKQPSTTKQISEVKLPAWVEGASQENYNLAKLISNKPLTQYQGQTVADPSNMTTSAYDLLMRNIGAGDPLYQQAHQLYTDAAGPFDPTKYYNPYRDEVENRAIGAMERSNEQQSMAIGDKARKAGAFGGSRGAIESAVQRAEGSRGIGDLSAMLRKEGYDTSVANMFSDREGMRASAQGILGTAEGRQNALYKDITGLIGAGETERGYRQQLIDADVAKFDEANNYDLERLNTRLAALGMSPYGKTETTTKTGQQGQSGTDWATLGLGILKLIPGLSDRRDKTDIKRLDAENQLDLPLYSYRYKGDPKNTPKVVGPMAQDVERKYPELVTEVGGHKTVPIGVLMSPPKQLELPLRKHRHG